MRNKFIYFFFFVIIGVFLSNITINHLLGSNIRLTFLDMFYPIMGSFIGTPLGILAALFLMPSFTNATSLLGFLAISRILPISLGALSFTEQHPIILVAPLLSMVAFLAHPVGSQVWYFPMLWLIPFFCWSFKKKSLLARSFSSTYISHAVGGAIWIWAFPTTPAFWQTLIPIVLVERAIFAFGMSAFYVLINNLGYFLQKHNILSGGLVFDTKRLLLK